MISTIEENRQEREFDSLKPKIKELIEQRQWAALRTYLEEWPAPDLADLLTDLEKTERVFLFRMLPRQILSEVFSHLEPTHKDSLLKDLTDEEARHLLGDLTPDDRTDFLEELPGQAIQRLLNLLSPEDLKEARLLLGYPDESVGRLMTPNYVAVRPDWTIGQVFEHIRNRGRSSETINVIFVTDVAWKLIDALDLRLFILADPSDRVEQIMDYTYVSILATDDREKTVQLIQRYDLIALPVVDSEGVLLGIVTVDDVLDVAQEETTEDFHKTAAVEPLKMSYRELSIWSLYSKRIVWLGPLLGINLVSAGVIAAYKETLSSVIALAFFIPLLIASGGNTGAQSSTLVVRALATGDIRLNQWMSNVSRELGIGFLLGVTMGSAGWLLGLFTGGLRIATVVSTAVVFIIVVSNVIGVTIPLILTKFRVDPAVASSPLITSIADVVGLIIYFSIAAKVLQIL